MRRILPLKPVSASSNSQVPNSSAESVQRDKGQPKQQSSGCGKDESGVVNCHGKDNLKGLKENSLGAKLRREHLSPVRRPFPSGEENLPFIRDRKPKVNAKNVRENTPQKGHRHSTSGSSIFSTASSSQRNLKSSCDVRRSFTGDGYNFLHGIQSASCGVASKSHIEDEGKKLVKKKGKIPWTKRSVSKPKDHTEETNEAEIQISPKSNTIQVPKAPKRLFSSFLGKNLDICTKSDTDKSTLGEPQEISMEGDEPNRSSDYSSLIILSEEVPVEVENFRDLVKSRSVRSLTDSYEPFSNLTGNTSPKQSGLDVSRSSFSSIGESVADKLSFSCQSARAAAKNLAGALPENCKSHLTNTNCLEMKKPFDWQTITEDEDKVGAATEVSVSATFFVNTHSSFTEEESASFKFFEDSPIGRQAFSSEDHWSAGNSISGTTDTSSERGRFQRSLATLSSNKEDTGRFRMWCEIFHKFEDDDDNLKRRAKESEEQAQLLSKEMELMKTYGSSGPTQTGAPKKAEVNVNLKQKLKNLCEEKINLFLEVASQIRSRLSDRAAANEAFKLLSGEIKSGVKMAEKEKCAVKLSLENELDRQSREWGTKLEKFKLNEKKMRDRLRDLAEQNVALQREISYLSNKESDLKNQLRESEVHTDDFKTRLKDAENEILMLRKSLEKSHKQTKEAEDDQHLIRRSYDLKERENYALQKSIIRLQRLCKDQERTITGLCKGLNDEIDDIPQEKNDHITKLQDELLRVTGEDQALCKDLRNWRSETDALGPKNVCILGIQKSKEEGNGYGLIKVDEELRARLEELQSQALSLLDENSTICAKLLGVIKSNIYYSDGLGTNEAEEALGVLSMEQKRNIVVEHEVNLQRLKRKVQTLRKSVHMVKGILKEKTIISCNHIRGEDMDKTDMLQSEFCSSEAKEQINELQHELKAETTVSRILREKLCSREFEVEQLQEDVAKLKESQEILEAEIGRLQDLLSTANHKTRDLEYQLEVEEERIRFLETGFQRKIQEQAVLREELTNVSKERDAMQQQTERLGWEVMRLNAEAEAFQRKVEKLDEELMLKDGQISILRTSLDDCNFSVKP